MSTHAYTPRHSITIRPIGGITPDEIKYCLSLLTQMVNHNKVLKAVVGKEVIVQRNDSCHLHIRLIYHKNYRSAESTKQFKALFDEGRLSGRSIKTTQPTKSMRNQSEAVFWSYALKDCYDQPKNCWLFNVDMNSELQSVCHEAFLAHLEKQVPIVVVTSTNVDTIMKEFIDTHHVNWETAFIEMYKSKDPIYQMNFLSARNRLRLSIAVSQKPDDVDKILTRLWKAYIGRV
jgi:hypothetical protein